MNYFGSEKFVLSTAEAREIYSECKDLPVFDYHNHLSPELLYKNECFSDISDFWLSGDHYVWRAMRLAGIEEKYITGDAPGKEKFLAWVSVLDGLMGSQLYIWTQMQMSFLFGCDELLSSENAEKMYEHCTALLQTDDFRPRALLKKFGVNALCTTDEPFDSLEYHKLLQENVKDLLVLPAFRPDKLLTASLDNWCDSVRKLSISEGMEINTLDDLKTALTRSLERFKALGCRTSDHGYEGMRYSDPTGADEAFLRAMKAGKATAEDEAKISSELFNYLGKEYDRLGMVMQLHIGALRNGSTRKFRSLGADCGGDSVDDPCGVKCMLGLLDGLDMIDKLPKTILYCLNESDYASLAPVAATFAGPGIKNKVQLGAAWWFNDHDRGMRRHLSCLMENAMLAGFVGMLTDSRSIGSFVRHDYFRRILCDELGKIVAKGEFPMSPAKKIAADICLFNALSYFEM